MFMKITKRMKQIIVGKILGDAHLESFNGKTFRLKIEHSYMQKEYVDWLYELLKEFCSTPPTIKERKIGVRVQKNYFFQTKSLWNFKFFGDQFYKDKKKVVPKRIVRKLLTPLSVAVWFMDDGSVKSNETNGRIFNTQGFTKEESEILSNALNSNFGLHTRLRQQKEGFQIFVPAGDSKTFYDLIHKFVLPTFYYKLPKIKS